MNTCYSVLKQGELKDSIKSLQDSMIGVRTQDQLSWLYSLILLNIVQKYKDEVSVEETDEFYNIDALSLIRFFDNKHYCSDTFITLHMFHVTHSSLGRHASMDLYKELVLHKCNQVNKFADFCELGFKF